MVDGMAMCGRCFGMGVDMRSGSTAARECPSCGGKGIVSVQSIIPVVIDPMVCRFCGVNFETGYVGLYQISVHVGAAWKYEAQACPECRLGLERALKWVIQRWETEKKPPPEPEGRNILL